MEKRWPIGRLRENSRAASTIAYRRLLLVALPLQQLALLVLAHLLAALLDDTTQRASPRPSSKRPRDVRRMAGARSF